MDSTTVTFSATQRRALERIAASVSRAIAWPARVCCARQLMHALGRMEDHELRDIGLTRGDLHDVNALALDADPSSALRRRVEERRRRR